MNEQIELRITRSQGRGMTLQANAQQRIADVLALIRAEDPGLADKPLRVKAQGTLLDPQWEVGEIYRRFGGSGGVLQLELDEGDVDTASRSYHRPTIEGSQASKRKKAPTIQRPVLEPPSDSGSTKGGANKQSAPSSSRGSFRSRLSKLRADDDEGAPAAPRRAARRRGGAAGPPGAAASPPPAPEITPPPAPAPEWGEPEEPAGAGWGDEPDAPAPAAPAPRPSSDIAPTVDPFDDDDDAPARSFMDMSVDDDEDMDEADLRQAKTFMADDQDDIVFDDPRQDMPMGSAGSAESLDDRFGDDLFASTEEEPAGDPFGAPAARRAPDESGAFPAAAGGDPFGAPGGAPGGHDPFGGPGGGDPFAAPSNDDAPAEDPFAAAAAGGDPFGGDPFGGGGGAPSDHDPFGGGGGGDPFGGGAALGGSDPFGAGAASGGSDPFGGGAGAFGASSSAFNAPADEPASEPEPEFDEPSLQAAPPPPPGVSYRDEAPMVEEESLEEEEAEGAGELGLGSSLASETLHEPVELDAVEESGDMLAFSESSDSDSREGLAPTNQPAAPTIEPPEPVELERSLSLDVEKEEAKAEEAAEFDEVDELADADEDDDFEEAADEDDAFEDAKKADDVDDGERTGEIATDGLPFPKPAAGLTESIEEEPEESVAFKREAATPAGPSVGAAKAGKAKRSAAPAKPTAPAPKAAPAPAPMPAPAPVVPQAPARPPAPPAAPAEEMREVEVEREIGRKATARYHSQMNPMRCFPLLVIMSKETIKEIKLVRVRQVEAKQQVRVRRDNPYVEIEPVFPGCIVTPSKIRLDVTPKESQAVFWVNPLAEGNYKEAQVNIYYEGRKVSTIDTPTRVVKTTVARMALAFSMISPVLSGGLDALDVQVKEQLPFVAVYLLTLLNAFGGMTMFGLFLGVVGLVVAVVVWWMRRPKRADPVVAFFDVQS